VMDQTASSRMPLPLMWDHTRRRHGSDAGMAGRKASRWMQLFAFLGFSILSSALTPALRFALGQGVLPPGASDPANSIAQSVILITATIYFYRKPHVLMAALRPMPIYLVIIAICALSTAWSSYPFLTIKRSVTLTNCILFGIVCVDQLGLDGTVKIYGRTMIWLMLFSLIVFVAVPSVGKETAETYQNGMRGVFSQKNQLGTSAALAISSFCYVLLAGTRRPLRAVTAIMFLFLCIVLSKSATALTIGMLVVGITLGIFAKRNGVMPLFTYGVFVFLTLLLVIAAVDPQLLFALIGRDLSLTGRVPLWQMSMKFVWERPWTGYGYSGFWNEDSVNVKYIWQAIEWEAPSAHNGYIDVILQIGFPGLALYLYLWGRIIYDGARVVRSGKAPEAMWIMLFMALVVLLNMDEGPLPYPDQYTAMMPAILIYLYNWRKSHGPGLAAFNAQPAPPTVGRLVTAGRPASESPIITAARSPGRQRG